MYTGIFCVQFDGRQMATVFSSSGHVVVSVRENFDADPAWMKLRHANLTCVTGSSAIVLTRQLMASNRTLKYFNEHQLVIYLVINIGDFVSGCCFLQCWQLPRNVATHLIHFEELVAYDKAGSADRKPKSAATISLSS